MSLRSEIRNLEDDLNKILLRLQELRLKVDAMEVQNAKLLDKVSLADIESEGVETLTKLYQEGYHICPTHFTQPRNNEECLFCLSFLKGDKA